MSTSERLSRVLHDWIVFFEFSFLDIPREKFFIHCDVHSALMLPFVHVRCSSANENFNIFYFSCFYCATQITRIHLLLTHTARKRSNAHSIMTNANPLLRSNTGTHLKLDSTNRSTRLQCLDIKCSMSHAVWYRSNT